MPSLYVATRPQPRDQYAPCISHGDSNTSTTCDVKEVRPAVKSKVEELLLSGKDVSPLVDHDISEETLESEEFALEYMKRFPAVDSYTKLTVSRDLQKSEIKENDLNDIMALSVAIPYCDLVLTENFWASVSSQCDLEDDYGGVVSSDLSEVTNLL